MKKIFTFFFFTLVSFFLFGQGCPTLVDINSQGKIFFHYADATAKGTNYTALEDAPTVAITITDGVIGSTTLASPIELAKGAPGIVNGGATNPYFRTSEVYAASEANNEVFSGTVTLNFTAGAKTCVYENGLLPVSLSSFTAKKMEQSILLDWETEMELNNDYFAVERSMDGKNFEKLTEISGKGTSEELVAYNFEDKKPNTATNYYRLRQVDYDGTEAFSEIITVKFKDTGLDLNLYPTIAQEAIHLDLTNNGNENVAIKILDATGHVVFSKMIKSKNIFTLNLENLNLSKGMYFVHCQTVSQNTIGKFLLIK